jgi:hypothetical protein
MCYNVMKGDTTVTQQNNTIRMFWLTKKGGKLLVLDPVIMSRDSYTADNSRYLLPSDLEELNRTQDGNMAFTFATTFRRKSRVIDCSLHNSVWRRLTSRTLKQFLNDAISIFMAIRLSEE